MKKGAIFVACLVLCNSLLFAELTKPQLWAISLTGIMTEINNSNRNALYASTMDERGRDTWRNTLSRDWGITTRAELFETLDSLETGGHAASFREIQEIIRELLKAGDNSSAVSTVFNRYEWDVTKYNRFMFVAANWNEYEYLTIKAWDLGRSISLCRWGYNAGFITENEAWERIFRIAKIIQPLYRSWEEYGYDYFMGRIFWASGFEEEISYIEWTEPIYMKLMNSYWSWLDWNIDLDMREMAVPPVSSIRFSRPDDNDGTMRFSTIDPALYNRYTWQYMSNPNTNPNVYECRVKKISGDDSSGYGMIFCVDDSDSGNVSFYMFLIAVDGTFLIQKRTSNTLTNMPAGWADSSSIKAEYNAYNTLRIERTDNGSSAAFRAFINGEPVVSFTDDNPLKGIRTGQIVEIGGMEMEQFPHIPVDVRFYY
jgi:hypothetical protein